MKRESESMSNSILLWKDMHEMADKVCAHFGLTYSKIVPSTKKLAKYYGACWPCKKCIDAEHINAANCSEKIIYIRLHQLNKPRVALARKTILYTLAHELAHLGEWNHGRTFDEFEKEVSKFMRELGYEI